jgi:hypothetical protein
VPVEARSIYRGDHTHHQIHWWKLTVHSSEPVPDYPLDPISRTGSGHRFLADDETQPGVVHSIENQVET